MMAEAVQARAQVIIDAALEASSKKDIVDDKALGKMTGYLCMMRRGRLSPRTN